MVDATQQLFDLFVGDLGQLMNSPLHRLLISLRLRMRDLLSTLLMESLADCMLHGCSQPLPHHVVAE